MEYATLGLRRSDSWLYKFRSSIQIECDITAFLDNSNDEEKKMGRKVEKKQTINFSKALRLLIQIYSCHIALLQLSLSPSPVFYLYFSKFKKNELWLLPKKMYPVLRISTHHNSI